jgi:hypothetical protein
MFFQQQVVSDFDMVVFWVLGIALAAFLCWLTDFMKKDRNR